MRPQTVSVPYPLHRTDADPRRFGHGRAGPVARCRRRPRQRHGHHALGHLRTQRRNARWPRFIAPKFRRAVVAEPLLPAPAVLALPVARMISAVPRPSVVRRTIFARQTCFCGLLRFATTASSSRRCAGLNRVFVRSCIPQTRTRESARESPGESKCQIWSTSCVKRTSHEIVAAVMLALRRAGLSASLRERIAGRAHVSPKPGGLGRRGQLTCLWTSSNLGHSALMGLLPKKPAGRQVAGNGECR